MEKIKHIAIEDIDKCFDSIFKYVEDHVTGFEREEYIKYAIMIAETIQLEKDKQKEKSKTMEILKKLDLKKDQHLMSIRVDGECMGHVEIENEKIITSGFIGNNTYDNFVDLIYGLQGHGIKIDDFYF